MSQIQQNQKAGLGALLTPDNCALLLIDHQAYQFAGLNSHDGTIIINNTVGLAKTAKAFNIPTLLTTIIEQQGGFILKQLQDLFPDQTPINRTNLNSWEDKRVTDWVKATDKKKIIIAGLWSEVCVAFPAIHAAGEGYEVYVVTDASGGTTAESHQMAVQRMINAGVTPVTWGALVGELQRDWSRTETVPAVSEVVINHMGGLGVVTLWERQLLNTPVAPAK
jgi:nicotinamidase-related amidase